MRLALLALSGCVFGGASRANAAAAVPADHGSVICNHYLPPGTVFPEVRCNDAVVPGGILLFPRGTRADLELPVRNDRAETVQADYVLEQIDRQGVVMKRQAGPLALAARDATRVGCTIETAGLRHGVYSLVLRVTANGAPLAEREYYFGVISDAVIPKAAPGQFRYGLDPNYGGVVTRARRPAGDGKKALDAQRDLLGWLDASGADILRSAGFGAGPGAWATDIDDEMAIIRQRGWQIVAMAIPPEPNPQSPAGAFEKAIGTWAATLEEVVRRNPDVLYWEVGNEPDLGYPGIEHYVKAYEASFDAIKRGNPAAQAMNGGITFFGEKGPANSRRFLELVNPAKLDVIAFHAHGPGSRSEQKIHEHVRRTAAEFGLGEKPVADTESGMFVGSKRQEEAQAWMVLQKQAYAQALGLNFLMTFRLHAFRRGDLGYGMLRSDQEPLPAFIAYRAMTEHLKGLAFQKKLATTQSHAEGYGFAESGGPRRVCVLWSNETAFYNIYLKIAPSAAKVGNPRLMDIYGNNVPADVSEDGVVRVETTEAPVYILWDALDSDFQADVTRSMLRAPDMATVVPHDSAPLEIGVSNPSDTPLTATLRATIATSGPASVTPDTQTLVIPPKATTPVRLSVAWNPAAQDLAWPSSWTVYSDLPDSDVDLAGLREIPAAIQGHPGRVIESRKGFVNLLLPGELPREKRAGFVFGSVTSDRDQTVRIGCIADWWMQARLNGELIGSTLKEGNQGMTLTERVLELPLKQGRNLLAFKILSGKGGWSLTLASPGELPALLDPRKAADCIDLSLDADGKTLATERLGLRPVRRVSTGGTPEWNDPVESWTARAPDFVLEGAHVTNLFDKLPDSSRFWQGDHDLSAKAWLYADDRHVYLAVLVADDRDFPGASPEADSLRVGIAKDPSIQIKDTIVIPSIHTIGRKPDGRPVSSPETRARVELGARGTFYLAAFDRALAGDGVFRLNFLVNDNDDGYRKQFIELAKGLEAETHPETWPQLILGPRGESHPPAP